METTFEGKKSVRGIKDPLRRVIKKVEDSKIKKVDLSQKAIFGKEEKKNKNGSKRGRGKCKCKPSMRSK